MSAQESAKATAVHPLFAAPELTSSTTDLGSVIADESASLTVLRVLHSKGLLSPEENENASSSSTLSVKETNCALSLLGLPPIPPASSKQGKKKSKKSKAGKPTGTNRKYPLSRTKTPPYGSSNGPGIKGQTPRGVECFDEDSFDTKIACAEICSFPGIVPVAPTATVRRGLGRHKLKLDIELEAAAVVNTRDTMAATNDNKSKCGRSNKRKHAESSFQVVEMASEQNTNILGDNLHGFGDYSKKYSDYSNNLACVEERDEDEIDIDLLVQPEVDPDGASRTVKQRFRPRTVGVIRTAKDSMNTRSDDAESSRSGMSLLGGNYIKKKKVYSTKHKHNTNEDAVEDYTASAKAPDSEKPKKGLFGGSLVRAFTCVGRRWD